MAEKRYISPTQLRFKVLQLLLFKQAFFFPYSLPQARVIFQCCCLLSRPCFHVCNIEFFYSFITTRRTARKARMKTQRHIWNVTLAGRLMDTMNQLSYFQTLFSCLQH